MKRKDLVFLVIAVAILLVAGYIVYTQLMGGGNTKATTPKVEVVGTITQTIDADGTMISQMKSDDLTDYTVPVDALAAGNPALFGR